MPAALQAVFWSMIDLMGSFRMRCDVIILLLLMVTAPYTVCFMVTYTWTDMLGIIDPIIVIIFAIDIYLNCGTGLVGETAGSRQQAAGSRQQAAGYTWCQLADSQQYWHSCAITACITLLMTVRELLAARQFRTS
jgi:hypothetical protein